MSIFAGTSLGAAAARHEGWFRRATGWHQLENGASEGGATSSALLEGIMHHALFVFYMLLLLCCNYAPHYRSGIVLIGLAVAVLHP